MKTITILLADDHKLVVDGLRHLLEREVCFHVVAEAGDGEAAVRMAREVHPDLVLMDVTMPGVDGIAATKRLAAMPNSPKVVGLSMHTEPSIREAMLQAGAVAYVSKDDAFQTLVGVLKGVCAKQLAEPSTPGSAGAPKVGSRLTRRETEILRLVAGGLSSKQIAARLSLSLKTVLSHRAHIASKLDIHSAATLTRYAIQHGLIDVPVTSSPPPAPN